ncbi:MAG UNVERIFIED_CONTAM: DUF5132 domain-containing protein [Microcystis novacekii LVE1205-3]|jgi:hypothetical protein
MEELLVVGGVGVVAILVLGSLVGLASPQTGKAITDTGRNAAKSGIELGMEASEKLQATFAEAGQSWQDLVAEAKAETAAARNTTQITSVEETSQS